MRSGTGTLIVTYDGRKCDHTYNQIMQALETGVDVVLLYVDLWLYNKNLDDLLDDDGDPTGEKCIRFNGLASYEMDAPYWQAVSIIIYKDNTVVHKCELLSNQS